MRQLSCPLSIAVKILKIIVLRTAQHQHLGASAGELLRTACNKIDPSNPKANIWMPPNYVVLAMLAEAFESDHTVDTHTFTTNKGSAYSSSSRLQIMGYLLDHGAVVDALDSNGVTPLMSAAAGNHGNAAGLLCDHGANVSGLYSCLIPVAPRSDALLLKSHFSPLALSRTLQFAPS